MHIDMTKELLPEILITPSNVPDWYGGAYTLAFVYSNKGNFILKGYLKEIQDELEKKKKEGLKYYVNLTLWHKGQSRNILKFYKDTVCICEPKYSRNNRWNKDTRKYKIYYYDSKYIDDNGIKPLLTFKRLPKNWIPSLDTL